MNIIFLHLQCVDNFSTEGEKCSESRYKGLITLQMVYFIYVYERILINYFFIYVE